MLAWLRRLLGWKSGPVSEAARRGAEGEEAAARYLRDRCGYAIVTRNWRSGKDEIDIVARDGDVLVFVEVKTRSARALVRGYESIDRRKKTALRRAVHAYLTQLRARRHAFRFDVIEVAHAPGVPLQPLHFQNIPLFPRGYRALR